MIVLGIDPGTNKCGWAIIDRSSQPALVASGVIKNKQKFTLPEKLSNLYKSISEISEKYSPDAACVEGAFMGRNARSGVILSQARGAIITSIHMSGVKEIGEIAPQRVKKMIAGSGRAGKDAVMESVRKALDIKKSLSDDESDAIAIALAYKNLD